MSELKAIRSGEIYDIIEYEDCYRTDDLYYPKSEADKVIAHHKYKRCLAMAKWSAAECVVNQDIYKRYLTHKSEFRIGHFRKWYNRWIAIAEKFKDGK